MTPLLLSLALGLQLKGAATCPSVDSVQRALLGLGETTGDEGPLAEIAADPNGVRVTLISDGQLLSRTLPPSNDCEALARAVAITLAIWDTQFATSQSRVVAGGTNAASTGPPPDPLALSLGAAAGGSLASNGAGFVAEFVFTLGRAHALVGATGSLRFDGPHQAALGSGSAVWTREVAGVGAALQPTLGPFKLALGAELLAGAIEVDGRNFQTARDNVGPELGLSFGPRLSWTHARVAPFVGIQGIVWLLGQQVHADGTSATANLSTFEIWAEGGCTYRF